LPTSCIIKDQVRVKSMPSWGPAKCSFNKNVFRILII
jgi:hypothetical protein